MKQFFRNNKIFIGIIIAAFIIGGFIYLSQRPVSTTLPVASTGGGSETGTVKKTPGSSGSPQASECIDYTEAGRHVGEYACVIGKVDNIYTSSKGNNFLNFCPNYKTCPFSAIIFSSDTHKFSNIKGYEGKTVDITGLIKTYQGRAEIIINDPTQIKIK